MNNFMHDTKNILISGAAGFLGSKLLEALSKHDYNVTAIARDQNSYSHLQQQKNLNWVFRDIALSPLTHEEASYFDTVIHLAGATEGRGDDIRMHCLANEMTTIGLASQYKGSINKFIYASTQVVYGNPNSKRVDENFPLDLNYSNYATSKINSENWLRLYQAKASNTVVILRLCGFVDGGGLIDALIQDALLDNDLELFGYGNVCRDYIHSSIFVDLIIRLLATESTPKYSIINVGSGQEMSALEIALLIKGASNSSSKIIRSEKPPRKNDFVYNIDKLLSLIDLSIPSLKDQIISHVKSKAHNLPFKS